jgi:hypothetical protein
VQGIASTLRSLDWSDSDGHEGSKVLTSLEVLLGVPVSLSKGSVGLDGLLVEEPVLRESSGQLGWLFEDLSPLLNGGDVVTHAFAGTQSVWELEDGEADLKDALSDVVPTTLLEVTDSGVNLAVHELGSLEAGLDFNEVVVSSHTVDETGGEVWESNDIEVLDLVGWGLNLPEEESEGISGVDTGLEVVASGPIELLLSNVGLDGLLVESEVLNSILDGSRWTGEDVLLPSLESGKVVLHFMAWSKISLDVCDGLFGKSDGLDHFTSLESLEGILKIGDLELGASVTSLDLGQVVVTSETIEESSNEVWDCHDTVVSGGGVGWGGLDWSDGNSEEVSSDITSREVLSVGPVRLEGGNISLHLLLVGKEVLAHGLDDLLLVLEDLGPLLDGLDVFRGVLAIRNISFKRLNKLTQVGDGGVLVSALESRDGLLDQVEGLFAVRVAELKLSEVVLGDHAVDESRDKLNVS